MLFNFSSIILWRVFPHFFFYPFVMASLSVKYWIFWIDVFTFILRFSFFSCLSHFLFTFFECLTFSNLISSVIYLDQAFSLEHFLIACWDAFHCPPEDINEILFLKFLLLLFFVPPFCYELLLFSALRLLFTFVLCCWVLHPGPHSTRGAEPC